LAAVSAKSERFVFDFLILPGVLLYKKIQSGKKQGYLSILSVYGNMKFKFLQVSVLVAFAVFISHGLMIQDLDSQQQCLEGNCKDGFGKMLAENGKLYVGQWKNSMRHGKGKETSNGFTYNGDFEKDLFHGKGELEFPDGAKYVGEFKEGNFHGKGLFTRADGGSIDSEWQENQPVGFVKSVLSDGTTYLGPFENSAPEGKGKEIYPNQVYYEGLWHLGKRHGAGVIKDSREKIIFEGEFKDGQLPTEYQEAGPSEVLVKDVNRFVQILEPTCKEIQNEGFFEYKKEGPKHFHIWLYNICGKGVGYYLNFTADPNGGVVFEFDLKVNRAGLAQTPKK
jgi:hypothetical protein